MLRFTVHEFGKTALFRCAGRLVSTDAERLREAIRAQSYARTVVLDLANISAIDAGGVGTLVSLHAWAQATARDFKLMNLTPVVEEVLEITHLRSVFEICSVPEMLDFLCEAVIQAQARAASQIG